MHTAHSFWPVQDSIHSFLPMWRKTTTYYWRRVRPWAVWTAAIEGYMAWCKIFRYLQIFFKYHPKDTKATCSGDMVHNHVRTKNDFRSTVVYIVGDLECSFARARHAWCWHFFKTPIRHPIRAPNSDTFGHRIRTPNSDTFGHPIRTTFRSTFGHFWAISEKTKNANGRKKSANRAQKCANERNFFFWLFWVRNILSELYKRSWLCTSAWPMACTNGTSKAQQFAIVIV